MQKKDFLITALAPVAVLMIPLVGNVVSEEWNWSPGDFIAMWCVLAGATFVFRLLVSRKEANFFYKAGSALAVSTGLLITWVSMAVQIIGDENPANVFYLGVILTGLLATALSRFRATGLAHAAFATAAATFIVPVIAVIAWPTDFSPGIPQVFFLNGCFVAMFATAGLLLRQAAERYAAKAA